MDSKTVRNTKETHHHHAVSHHVKANDDENNHMASFLDIKIANQKYLPLLPPDWVEDGDGKERWRGPFERIFIIMEDPRESKVGVLVTAAVLFFIAVSTCAFCLETIPSTFQYRTEECEQRCKPIKTGDPGGDLRAENTTAEFCRLNDCEPRAHETFVAIENFCCLLFTIEYCLRVFTSWTIPSASELVKKKRAAAEGKSLARGMSAEMLAKDLYEVSIGWIWRSWWFLYPKRMLIFAFGNFMVVIDLLAILPCWIPGFGVSLSFVRMVRLFRVLRLMRVSNLAKRIIKFSEGVLTFIDVFKRSTLALLILFIYSFFFMVLMAAIVYEIEKGEWNPADGRYKRKPLYYLDADEDSPFESVPATFWWTLVTFTTVGYGDMSPTTTWGRVVGVVAMYGGILFIAMPITIIGTQFQNMYDEQEARYKKQHEDWLNAGRTLIKALLMPEDAPLLNAFKGWLRQAQRSIEKRRDVRAIVKEEQDKLSAALKTELAELRTMVEGMLKP